MLRTYVFVTAAVLALAPMAHAQGEVENQQSQQPETMPAPEVRQAIPRSEAPRPTPAPRAEAVRSRAEAPAAAADDAQGRAVPRGGRPRGDNPPVGTAVPREQGRRTPPPPVTRSGGDNRDNRADGRDRNGGRAVYARPPVYNNNYYYYPRRSYPYGYGAFGGLGYFYYDPYAWYPGSYSAYSYGAGAPGYSGYYPGRAYSDFDTGYLRLRVSPRQAQVFVDGYFAGEVDDYDGIVQAMKLEEGPYHIEIVAPGYETLEFDVRIIPGQKIQYRGDLRRQP